MVMPVLMAKPVLWCFLLKIQEEQILGKERQLAKRKNDAKKLIISEQIKLLFHRKKHFSLPVSYTHLTLPTNREV